MGEPRSISIGNVAEMAAAVVFQQGALGVDSVAARYTATANEEINRAVPIEIGGAAAGAARGWRRHRASRFAEISLAVVQVKPVLQCWRPLGEFTASCGNI